MCGGGGEVGEGGATRLCYFCDIDINGLIWRVVC